MERPLRPTSSRRERSSDYRTIDVEERETLKKLIGLVRHQVNASRTEVLNYKNAHRGNLPSDFDQFVTKMDQHLFGLERDHGALLQNRYNIGQDQYESLSDEMLEEYFGLRSPEGKELKSSKTPDQRRERRRHT